MKMIQTSKGFTILEVLVAMVILAIGVLGLGVLQLSSLQNTQGGQMRSQASILAYDIVDTMRGNMVGVAGTSYGLEFDDIRIADPDTWKDSECYGTDVDCTPTEMAQADLFRWRENLAAALPSGLGEIDMTYPGGGNPTAPYTAVVTVTWVDPYSAANGTEQVSITTRLQQ
jgi:type IV pilus assembly protein PilV